MLIELQCSLETAHISRKYHLKSMFNKNYIDIDR